jgi:hypothetical protein
MCGLVVRRDGRMVLLAVSEDEVFPVSLHGQGPDAAGKAEGRFRCAAWRGQSAGGGEGRILLRALGVTLRDNDTKTSSGSGRRLRLIRWKTCLVVTKRNARFSFHQPSHLTAIKPKHGAVQGGRGQRGFA